MMIKTIFSAKYLALVLTCLLLLQQTHGQQSGATRVVRVEAVGGMQYAPLRFRVRPGERVRLVFSNTDDMSHNLLITRPGARVKIVEQALALGEKGPEMDFIPESPDVLWSIPVLGPGEKDSIVFTAPEKEAVYPYVCTFPGHGSIMYGAMHVTGGELPSIEADRHIPEAGRKTSASHPYELVPPFFYRIYMPGASPAAIAVRLNDHLSYCWDAGTCQLLYSWEGGFIDNSIAWKGHRNAEAAILGEIFYKAENQCPVRTGGPENIPEVKYKGFRLVDRYPEFHFTVNGVDVYEILHPGEDGHSLVLTFRVPGYKEPLWLDLNAKGAYRISASGGQWKGSLLQVPAEHAEKFSVMITRTIKK